MKEIEELKDRLRNEMVTRMDDSDIVDILTVLQRAEEEIDDWKQSHDKVARALEKSECEHKETMQVLHALHGRYNKQIKVSLADLEPGKLFRFGNTIGFKSEYQTGRAIEAFIVGSGEMFWGGTNTANEQRELMVCPIN
ncbi:TPA: hypothetical protein ACGW5B_000541 [Bacillus paranthracis]|uniref:hypothetical protein n=1 Tax=Bacillus cereus group TaxID=86661 RepID=UPI00254CBDDF|nr:hypothetical protein [Bacillus paranthracis]MDK7423421.1 hypothetical protein [Bacillus paranthracis]MDK7451167.1 hypothetical protein [Bacillus paranthracis]MDK7463208.1 hypothetical protein [Bacillus paranthracis]MDK7532045.1 hypothetical protein [Bacillus paranthracis]HDR3660963.1 hypothetical protein [Bacillus paranthracis]